MTIFAQAPVAEHHRLDRGTTIRLSATAGDAPIAGHTEALAVKGYQAVSEALAGRGATYSEAYDAASAAMLAPHGDSGELAIRVYAARLWMREHPEANLATADDALVGRWDAYNDACRALFPAVRTEVLAMESQPDQAPIAGHAEATVVTARVSAVPTPHVYASASAPCPPWCKEHVGGDPGWKMHDSGEAPVPATAGGPNEQGHIWVSLDRSDAPGQPIGAPMIRLDGTRDPMTPVEALQLAVTLQATAFAALLDVDAGRESTIGWAQSLIDDPTPSVAVRHGYTVEQAAKVQAIVADLVAQMEAEEAAEREGGQA